MDKRQYLEYLESYLTERRKARIEKISSERTRHFTIVAEDTYLDHNASALVRTCDCFGIQDLHIIEEIHRYRLAKRMTQGSEKWVTLHYYNNYKDNTQQCINRLRAQGFSIIGTSTNEYDCKLEEYDVKKKSALFFGKEKTGLSNAVLEQADALVNIPMYGFNNSFNVSVSAALVLQSVTRRLRQSDDIDWRLQAEDIIDLKIDWAVKSIPNGKLIAAKYLKEGSGPAKS